MRRIHKGLFIVVVSLLLTSWFAVGLARTPSKSAVKEYVETAVNVGLYAVPYSEPLSALLSSPNIARLGLTLWAKRQWEGAERDLYDAMDRGVGGRELERFKARADRGQAIYTCIATGDCSRLKGLEAKSCAEVSRRVRAEIDRDRALAHELGRELWKTRSVKRAERIEAHLNGLKSKWEARATQVRRNCPEIADEIMAIVRAVERALRRG